MNTQTCNECGTEFHPAETAEVVGNFKQFVEDNSYTMSDPEEAVYLGLYCLKCSNDVLIDKVLEGVYNHK